MYYLITWFGKRATLYSKEWSLNEQNGQNAMTYIIRTLRSTWWRGQAERGQETGRLHIQAMVESEYTLEDCMAIGKDRGWDWHIESVADLEEGYLYVGKKDTRIAGPWESLERETMDFEDYYKKRDWEYELEKHLKPGKVTMIIDTEGGMGKTTRAKIMEMREEATYIPALAYRDITRYAYNWASEHYIINIERMANIDRQDLWAGIELVSDGISYDDRYESKKSIREKPIIEVHANRAPRRKMMSDYKYEELEYINGELKPFKRKNIMDEIPPQQEDK